MLDLAARPAPRRRPSRSTSSISVGTARSLGAGDAGRGRRDRVPLRLERSGVLGLSARRRQTYLDLIAGSSDERPSRPSGPLHAEPADRAAATASRRFPVRASSEPAAAWTKVDPARRWTRSWPGAAFSRARNSNPKGSWRRLGNRRRRRMRAEWRASLPVPPPVPARAKPAPPPRDPGKERPATPCISRPRARPKALGGPAAGEGPCQRRHG